MVKTVVVDAVGGPEVMKFRDIDFGKAKTGEVRIRQTAVGINFADVHYRRGTAPRHAMAQLPFPFIPGLEAAGVIEEIGPGVSGLRLGDRVAYATATLTIGAYTEARLFPADRVIKLPDEVTDLDAAALLYRGITVHGMIRQCYPVKRGNLVLLHAAAGGVGSIIAQWTNHLGATVIGTVSDSSKVEAAQANGCHHVIVTGDVDFVARVSEITEGKGVDVVFDGVGADTFLRSFGAICKYGMMVSFGQAAGMMEPIDPVVLQHKGHYLTKFSGSTYNADVNEYHHRASEVLNAMKSGLFRTGMHTTYAFADIVRAHRDFEARTTTGPLVLKI